MNIEKLFSVEDLSTYPKCLLSILRQHSKELREYFYGKTVQSSNDAHCLLDDNEFWNKRDLRLLVQESYDALSGFSIHAFHNTRLIEYSSITENGLCLLDPNKYRQDIYALLQNSPFSNHIGALFSKLQPFLDNQWGQRTNMLAFFAPYRIVQNYQKFFGNVGGEVAEFAFYDCPELLSYLGSVGTPATVEFSMPIANINSYRIDYVIAELVRNFCCEKYLGMKYEIGFDATTSIDVPAASIIRIIPNKKT